MPIAVATTGLFEDTRRWQLKEPVVGPDGTEFKVGYETITRGIPVFDAHTEYDERKTLKSDKTGEQEPNPNYGKVTRDFDEKRLQKIADNCNARFKRTGDAAPLTLGHTRPGEPETAQPPICGWAINFRLGRYGPEKLLAILADFYVLPRHWKAFLEHPRRSVEFFPRDEVFDPIALLVRTPERDLGLIQAYMRERDTQQAIRYAFQAWQSEQPCERYACKCEGISMEHGKDHDTVVPPNDADKFGADDPNNPHKAGSPETTETDEGKPVPASDTEQHGIAGKPWDDEELPEDETKGFHKTTAERYHKHMMRHPEHGAWMRAAHDDYMKKNAEGQDATHKVGEGHEPITEPKEPEMGGAALAVDQDENKNPGNYLKRDEAVQYAKRMQKLEADLAEQQRVNGLIMAERNEARANGHVLELEGAGIDFGEKRGKEVQRFSKMTEAECIERKQEIMEHWQPSGAPTGGPSLFAGGNNERELPEQFNRRGQSEHFSREDAQKAIALAQNDPEYLKNPAQNWDAAYQRAVATVKAERNKKVG